MRQSIGLVTSSVTPCGITQFGLDLAQSLRSQGHSVDLIENADLAFTHHIAYHAFVLNWHPGRLALTAHHIVNLKNREKIVALVVHNSTETPDERTRKMVSLADVAIAHERMAGCEFVNHGIKEVANLPPVTVTPSIGTCGFLFPWKRPETVIEAARAINCFARVLCPPYPGFIQPDDLERVWRGRIGERLIMEKGYLPVEESVRFLASNWANVFFFDHGGQGGQEGQSGSVRMAIAARRPVVLCRHRKFLDLLPYEDELYFVDTESQLQSTLQGIMLDQAYGRQLKIPDRLVRDMGWSAVGAKISDLLEKAYKAKRVRF